MEKRRSRALGVLFAVAWLVSCSGEQRDGLAGGVTVTVVLGAVTLPAALVAAALPAGWAGLALAAALAWPWLAARALHEHVAAVARPLGQGDLAGARAAVSIIVGRDPARLDEGGVARAALESLAENASDGVVAPLFWGLVAGLPGLVAYKAINTLDSMIGHRNARHEDFGKVAARLDDLVNLVPARLTALLIALVSGRPLAALRTALAEARNHRSPNAGWPEAAMAAALAVRLSGPRVYGTRVSPEPWLNGAAPDPDALALRRGLAVFVRAVFLCGGLLLAIALL